jgi:predicted dehydrogenase
MTLKLGVIGTSWITAQFIEAAVQTQAYTLQAIYSRTVEKGEAFAATLADHITADGVDVVTSLSDLWAGIDVVYIASPNALHYQQAVEAIQNDVHVIVEKPSTSNVAEFEALETLLAQHPNVKFFEAARHIHQPNFKALQSALGELTDTQGATFTYQKYSSRFDDYLAGKEPNVLTREFSAGALYDLGVYPVYAALALFGKPLAVQYLPTLLNNGADGKGTAFLLYDGFSVTLLFGKNANSYLPSEIYGGKVTLSADNIAELGEVVYIDEQGQRDVISETAPANPMVEEAQVFADILNDPAGQHERYMDLLRLAKAVNQTLFDLRQSAGIVFPADEEQL